MTRAEAVAKLRKALNDLGIIAAEIADGTEPSQVIHGNDLYLYAELEKVAEALGLKLEWEIRPTDHGDEYLATISGWDNKEAR